MILAPEHTLIVTHTVYHYLMIPPPPNNIHTQLLACYLLVRSTIDSSISMSGQPIYIETTMVVALDVICAIS